MGGNNKIKDDVQTELDEGFDSACTIDYQKLEYDQSKNGIWWLASYPKSGNTWVRMFINCAVSKFPVNLNSAFQYCVTDLWVSMYQSTSLAPLNQMGAREAIYCRPAALLNYLASRRGRDCCMKTHHANCIVDIIPMCPPAISRGAAYIVRDPRDVAISFAEHCGMSIDEMIQLMNNPNMSIHRKGGALCHYLKTWSDHVKSWMSPENPIPTSCIRYEDMIEDPVTAFIEVLAALGLDEYVKEDAFIFAMEQTAFKNLKKLEETVGFRETGRSGRFFNRGKSGGWKNILTPEQAKQIETDHAEVMQDLGYL